MIPAEIPLRQFASITGIPVRTLAKRCQRYGMPHRMSSGRGGELLILKLSPLRKKVDLDLLMSGRAEKAVALAAKQGIPRKTVCNWVESGELKGTRIGRIWYSSLDELLATMNRKGRV